MTTTQKWVMVVMLALSILSPDDSTPDDDVPDDHPVVVVTSARTDTV